MTTEKKRILSIVAKQIRISLVIFRRSTMSPEDVADISSHIFAAALDQRKWDGVLKSINRCFPGVRTHIFTQDTVLSTTTGFYTQGYDPAFLEQYSSYYADKNSWAPSFSSARPGSVLASEEMISKEDLRNTEFYNDWVKPQEDITGGGGAVIERGRTSSALFGGNIREKDREFLEPQWMDFTRLILPMLQCSWRINRALAASEIERILPAKARTANAAVLLTDQNDRPVYANKAAEEMFAARNTLEVSISGRLRIAGLAHRFGDYLNDGFPNFIDMPIADHARVWIGKLLPSTFETFDMSFNRAGFIPVKVIVITSQQKQPDHVSSLQRLFGLTVAEAQVALLISEGYDINEISKLRTVSKNTVRFQVKASLEKLGVRRQTELALIIARTVSP